MDNRDPVRAALVELVAVRDLLQELSREAQVGVRMKTDRYMALEAEYNRRQPLAWAAARAAISTPAPDLGDLTERSGLVVPQTSPPPSAPFLTLTQAQANHLWRLLGWVKCEIWQSPDELVATVRSIAPQLKDISEEGKARLVQQHQKASNVPKYVRSAVKSLRKAIGMAEFDQEDEAEMSNHAKTVVPTEYIARPLDLDKALPRAVDAPVALREALAELLAAQDDYARCHMAEENAIRNYSGDQSKYSRATLKATERVTKAERAARALSQERPNEGKTDV